MVRTLVAKSGHPKGTKGVVVSIYSTGPTCEVELWDENDYPIDVITYPLNEVEVIECDGRCSIPTVMHSAKYQTSTNAMSTVSTGTN